MKHLVVVYLFKFFFFFLHNQMKIFLMEEPQDIVKIWKNNPFFQLKVAFELNEFILS